MARGKSPVAIAEGASSMAREAGKMAEWAAQVAQETNSSFQEVQTYIERLETSLSKMTEANAVAYHLLFEKTGITLEDRNYASLSLDAIKEFFSLISLAGTVRNTDSPLLIFEEIATNLPMLPTEDGEDCEKVLVLEFRNPREFHGEEAPQVTIVLSTKEGGGRLIDGAPPSDLEVDVTLTIDPKSFKDIRARTAVVDVAFMDHLIHVDDPYKLIEVEEMYNIREYIETFKAKEEVARPPEPTPTDEIQDADHLELSAETFAAEGHPDNAIMFGGDYKSE